MKTNLAVKVLRYVDDHQPGWMECEFLDANGRRHSFVDKVPGFTDLPLDADSSYPQPGRVCCEVLSRSQDALGLNLTYITTARPYHIESTEGLSEFVVLSEQLSS